jgi:hypothetical protein
MNYFFWLLLNIGVPLFGPVAMLATVAVSYGRTVAKRLIFDSVKDGQLFWSAIAISAAAVYELITALENGVVRVTTPISHASLNVPHGVLQFLLFGFLSFAFVGSLLVMLISLRKLDNTDQIQTSYDDLRTDARISISFVNTVAICFAILHFWIG